MKTLELKLPLTPEQEVLWNDLEREQRLYMALVSPLAPDRLDREFIDRQRERELVSLEQNLCRIRIAHLETQLLSLEHQKES
jgi:hypothetical protein